MEAQRTFLAITLCILVIVGWNFISPIIYPPHPGAVNGTLQNGTVTAAGVKAPVQNTTAANATQANAVPDAIMAGGSSDAGATMQAPEDGGRTINVDTPLMKVALSPTGGVIKDLELNKFTQKLGAPGKVKLIDSAANIISCLGIYINGQGSWTDSASWSNNAPEKTVLDGSKSATLTFTGNFNGLRITRELTFKADSYLITEKLHIQNLGAAAVSPRVSYALGTPHLSLVGEEHNLPSIAHLTAENSFSAEKSEEKLKKGVEVPNSRWGTVQNNYFLAAIVPSSENALVLGVLQKNVYRLRVEENAMTINPGATQDFDISYYMGPKQYAYLHTAPAELMKSMNYGWFGFISEPLIWFLNFLYSFIGNYGLAIILMTFIIKVLLWPIAQKSYKSMERMRKIQPFIKQIQEKHKGNKAEIQKETMRLYKAYKVNPAGGCLPILVQIPVFIGLYQGLINAIELRHAPFITHLPFTDRFWLADLSVADPYYITPLVMGATMFIQQKLTPRPSDPFQAKMMMFMPLMFIFFFLKFPSGLVVYWLTNNVLSIAQQWYTRYRTDKAQKKAESGKAETA